MGEAICDEELRVGRAAKMVALPTARGAALVMTFLNILRVSIVCGLFFFWVVVDSG